MHFLLEIGVPVHRAGFQAEMQYPIGKGLSQKGVKAQTMGGDTLPPNMIMYEL